mgnify:CR=1 FL=1
MAVYTHLGAEDLARLIAHYDVGELVMAKGIAEGVSNSNWLVETTGRSGGSDNSGTRFILTLYERRIDYADLPYFLDLLDHLASKGCPVPRTMHDRGGASFRIEQGKAAALIEFLPGVSPTRPTPAQARAVGDHAGQHRLQRGELLLAEAGEVGVVHGGQRCGVHAERQEAHERQPRSHRQRNIGGQGCDIEGVEAKGRIDPVAHRAAGDHGRRDARGARCTRAAGRHAGAGELRGRIQGRLRCDLCRSCG